MPFVAFLALAIVFYVVVKLWWLILGVAVVWLVGRTVGRAQQRRRDEISGLEARADEQHAWVLAGDDRGVYGEYLPIVSAP